MFPIKTLTIPDIAGLFRQELVTLFPSGSIMALRQAFSIDQGQTSDSGIGLHPSPLPKLVVGGFPPGRLAEDLRSKLTTGARPQTPSNRQTNPWPAPCRHGTLGLCRPDLHGLREQGQPQRQRACPPQKVQFGGWLTGMRSLSCCHQQPQAQIVELESSIGRTTEQR